MTELLHLIFGILRSGKPFIQAISKAPRSPKNPLNSSPSLSPFGKTPFTFVLDQSLVGRSDSGIRIAVMATLWNGAFLDGSGMLCAPFQVTKRVLPSAERA